MKKLVAFVLALLLTVCFCGCKDQQPEETTPLEKGNVLLEEGNVKNVSVTSQPAGYEYSFSADRAKEIVDYLLGLHLSADVEGDPEKLVGMTWVISLEYENGDVATVYHFGRFIRAENGPWYQMVYEEAIRFETLLYELQN